MTRTTTRSFAVAAAMAAGIALGCSETKPNAQGTTGAAETSATTTVTAAPSATVVETAAPPATASAPPTTSAAVPVASASGAPAASGSAAAGPKTFDCGAKGQKACPMQGWMKGVMGTAAANNDADKLASALSTAAAKPPPGMGSWTSIATAGAAKAKAGDIDGAKASCKQCHDLYKAKYQKEMRDRPW